MAKLNIDLNGDKNMKHQALWEAKTDKIIDKGIVRNKITDLRRKAAAELEQRKARLAALLEAEDRMYEREFHDNLETPEQVREAMFARLQHLKEKREDERQQEV